MTAGEKLVWVHEHLCETYECPIAYFHNLDPLSELVSSLLSHRTRNRDSGHALRALREKFGEWSNVRDADVKEIEAAIARVTWPEQKAPRIQAILRQITEERGELSLAFLENLPVARAREWLERFPGVGPKTSAAVLSFSSLRKKALPVDCHHLRVAARLELVPPKTSAEKSHRLLERLLPPEWDAQDVYDHHEVMMIHGQRCCFFESPACQRCPVLDECPHGQVRLKGRTRAA